MAAKRRRRPNHKLRSSFIATFSTLAAGLGGCGVTDETPSIEMEIPTAGMRATASPASSGSGGAGDPSGLGGAAANPGERSAACPIERPQERQACESMGPCYYADSGLRADPCDPLIIAQASCYRGTWSVVFAKPVCNPPGVFGPRDFVDEDAGQE